MGDVWAVLYVLGFLTPALLLALSSAIVLRLARRLRERDPTTRPRWQYLALHLLVGVAASIPLGPFGYAACLPVPGYLAWRLRRPASPADLDAARPARSWGLAALFVATGVLLPWAVGLGVKIYLDALGRPTLPLDGFLDPLSLAVMLPMTLVAWAFPFVILASAVTLPWRVGFAPDAPGRYSMRPIWWAYASGVVAALPVFTGVFWQFDTFALLMPIGSLLVPPMAVGYLVGWWMAR